MKQRYLVIILVLTLILTAGCVSTNNSDTQEANCIKVASFNIQVFGQSKINKQRIKPEDLEKFVAARTNK